jgi:ABC-type cobalamin transport system ATPase subunit
MRKTIVGKPTIFLTGLTYFVEQLGVTIFPACEYRLQTVNLDSISRQQGLDLLYEIMEETDLTIIFSTHITNDLDKIADYIILIDNGKIEFTCDKVKLEEELQIVNI